MQHYSFSNLKTKLNSADIARKGRVSFDIAISKEERAELVALLNIESLTDTHFSGEFSIIEGGDHLLKAQIKALIVQSCIITNAAVKTALNIEITQYYRANYTASQHSEEEGVQIDLEMNEDPLPNRFDFEEIFTEFLALNIPEYPRVKDAHLTERYYGPPDTKAMSDEDAKPFAKLAELLNAQKEP